MRLAALLLCAVFVFTIGCSTLRLVESETELNRSATQVNSERAKLLSQYRECLKRSETDSSADCSGYRTAIQVMDTRSDRD